MTAVFEGDAHERKESRRRMERYVCLHGHFYQPPRENPWLESIEFQESAYPYHDWNERVAAECYRPNSASRIMDAHGRIVGIVNNYARLSFNFGPTLLQWMEQETPETYGRVIDADQKSRERFSGHGSALAQAYNHIIMPLANRRDKVTQVRWGIADFQKRFGRDPEGMWLPETAVDVETLEVLAEHGMAFTILEPSQAKRVRKVGSEEWIDVDEGRVDPTRAYVAKLPSGRSIALFFYDGPISRAVAFENLLERGERLADRLTGAFHDERDWPQLVHIATDGETYGHHHQFGDMALAWALETLDRDPDIRLTIYGEYLEQHPPEWEVEIIEDTSWSCAHGVERWAGDCGCHTGGQPGWHQQWRAPLRAALDWLRDRVGPLYERHAGELLRDPWKARDHYIELIMDRSLPGLERYLETHGTQPLSADDRIRTLKLLELQRYAMFMYTSCGWFFNEVSGIETVQVIQYAGRVVQLAEELFGDSIEQEFLLRLEDAKSNLPEYGDGANIYQKLVRPAMVDLARVGAHYAVSSIFDPFETECSIYCYRVERIEYDEDYAGRSKLVVGQVRITSEITLESSELTFGVLYLGEMNLTGGVRMFRGSEAYAKLRDQLREPFSRTDFPAVIRILDHELGALTFSIQSLFRDEQRRVLNRIWKETLYEAEGIYRQLYDRYVPLMRFQAELGIPLPPVLRQAAEFAVNMHLLHEMEKDALDGWRVRALLQDISVGQLEVDQITLSRPLQNRIDSLVALLQETPSSLTLLKRINTTLDLMDDLPFAADRWRLQNLVYRIASEQLPEMQARVREGDRQAQSWVGQFILLGSRLNVYSESWMAAQVEK
ncbi:MAG TPA: DUF3536 domain-containing protein [Thermoanaerobaculia bacterium]|nr:DUF3536 domain-containing protein [Thermoanaerobaculia bacterium]